MQWFYSSIGWYLLSTNKNTYIYIYKHITGHNIIMIYTCNRRTSYIDIYIYISAFVHHILPWSVTHSLGQFIYPRCWTSYYTKLSSCYPLLVRFASINILQLHQRFYKSQSFYLCMLDDAWKINQPVDDVRKVATLDWVTRGVTSPSMTFGEWQPLNWVIRGVTSPSMTLGELQP